MRTKRDVGEATIISLAPYNVLPTQHHQTGDYGIRAKEVNEPYVKVVIRDAVVTKDFGDGRKEPVAIDAQDIAEDLVGVYRDDNLIRHGVFVAEGKEPTEEELANAKKQLEQTLREAIDDADSSWARYHDRKKISLHALKACEYFSLKREWAIDMRELVPCDGCQEMVAPAAIKCPRCGAIRDWDRARSIGLVTPEQYAFAMSMKSPLPITSESQIAIEIPIKRGPGRPRKDAVRT